MAANLDEAIRHVRTVALLHPMVIRRAPIGMYYIYEDRRIRLRASDQVGLDDFAVWAATVGDDWEMVLLWCPYAAEPERPRIFLAGAWIAYLRALSACRSRPWLDWRAGVPVCGPPIQPRLSKRRDHTALLAM